MKIESELKRMFRRSSLKPSIAPACALGCFFVWIDIAFRTDSGELAVQTSASTLLPTVGWLAALIATAACSALMAVHTMNKRSASDMDWLMRICQHLAATGSFFMTAGTLAFVLAGTHSPASLVGGLTAGAGSPLLIASWLPAAQHSNPTNDLLMVVKATIASVLIMSFLLLLESRAALALIVALPALSGLCTVIAIQFDRRRPGIIQGIQVEESSAKGSDITANNPPRILEARSIIVLASFFVVMLIQGIIGAPVSTELHSGTYWLFVFAGIAEIVLLIVMIVAFDTKRIHLALTALLATVITCAPFFFLAGYNPICVLFLKLTAFFSYALTAILLAERWRAGQNDLSRTRRQCCLFITVIAALTCGGIVVGDAVRQLDTFDGTIFALIAIILLYLVLIAVLLFFARDRQVFHIITGSFDSEEDIARARLSVLKKRYPTLSAREEDVLLLMLQNYSTPRIAEELVVSENTVKTHIRHIYAKLEVNSKQQLLAYAKRIAPLR